MDTFELLGLSVPAGFFGAALFWVTGLGIRMGADFLKRGGSIDI